MSNFSNDHYLADGTIHIQTKREYLWVLPSYKIFFIHIYQKENGGTAEIKIDDKGNKFLKVDDVKEGDVITILDPGERVPSE